MRVLIVCYVFPPVGGAGVQRVLKLVKYLPRYGITPAVLTARAPSVPLVDPSLVRDVPAGTEVVRARTFEPGYAAKQLAWRVRADTTPSAGAKLKQGMLGLARRLLVPDPQVLWLPAAQLALARRLCSSAPDDVVLISGPPFSPFLLAALARLRPGTAVVLDYRDEWTTTAGAYEMGAASHAGALLERAVLRAAHSVTTATEEFRAALLARFDYLDPERVVAIPNGYDPDDFPSELPVPPSDRCVVTYAGTVFRLTSARGLLAGVRLLRERDPELARLLELRFIGRIVETERDYFEDSEQLGVKQLGYLSHADTMTELAQSHATLCILDDVPGVERIYPAKVFELMRLGRPCLALTPEGALANLVRRHQLGQVLAPRDAPAIAQALAQMLRSFQAGTLALRSQAIDIARFDRREQAGRFAQVLRQSHARARDAKANLRRSVSPV
jgi:glycosyltransferase involved in cell wall biosynthesis